jgi:precorrin-6Y C5,15-methyltransferase (decarboxylating)
MRKEQPILLIGVGLRGPESLTAEMLERVQRADLLVGGTKILKGFASFSGKRLAVEGTLKELAVKIRRAQKEGKQVVVLTSGDPNFFGIARFLRRSFPPEALEIHPHVSSMQLAFARIGLTWEDAFFLSLHGREDAPVVDAVRRHDKVVVLTDPKHTPGHIARLLLKAGLPDCQASVCCRLGGEDEKVIHGSLSDLAKRRFPDLNVMIIFNTAPESPVGLPDQSLIHDKGMITKEEIRAVVIAKLRMAPKQILWDIGAASGSVAVEAVRMVEGATAFAVEKSKKRAVSLKRNITRLVPGRVFATVGEAPEALHDLPDPDRVFIGGGGKRLKLILRAVLKRLQSGGRIVVNAVTLDSLEEARRELERSGLRTEVISLQVGRGKELAGRVMMKAENPIFIVTAEKE